MASSPALHEPPDRPPRAGERLVAWIASLPRGATYAVLAALSAVGLYAGWSLFWFLCDDAFIAFRYISNSQLGHGYVWNAPPFRPVEGYTSFLWVALLDAVWTHLGVEPPESSNRLALAFSYGSVAIVFLLALKVPLSAALERVRPALVALVLLGTLTNRTWLAWTSSGLETALFTFLLLSWAAVALLGGWRRERPGGLLWGFSLMFVAGLVALCRPDGLLYVAFSGLLVTVAILARFWRGERPVHHLLAFLPLAMPIAHVAWRLETYGYPFPNTYYAKHVGWWPLSGAMYLLSFAIEYGLVLWIAVAVLVTKRLRDQIRANGLPVAPERALLRGIAIGAVLAHFAYYTFVIGGDHFEYRVYHHLVPLALIAFPWLLDRLRLDARETLGVFAMLLLLGLPIPWIHWAHTNGLETRKETHRMIVLTSPRMIAPLHASAAIFDGLQAWLISHHVCMRHQEHAIFYATQQKRYPPREDGLRIPAEGIPVMEGYSIGVPAWNLPNVAVIDKLGLNDLVVARTPVAEGKMRTMAHDRRPPEGYVACFDPNVAIKNGRPVLRKRAQPMTPERVRECEQTFLERFGSE